MIYANFISRKVFLFYDGILIIAHFELNQMNLWSLSFIELASNWLDKLRFWSLQFSQAYQTKILIQINFTFFIMESITFCIVNKEGTR